MGKLFLPNRPLAYDGLEFPGTVPYRQELNLPAGPAMPKPAPDCDLLSNMAGNLFNVDNGHIRYAWAELRLFLRCCSLADSWEALQARRMPHAYLTSQPVTSQPAISNQVW